MVQPPFSSCTTQLHETVGNRRGRAPHAMQSLAGGRLDWRKGITRPPPLPPTCSPASLWSSAGQPGITFLTTVCGEGRGRGG